MMTLDTQPNTLDPAFPTRVNTSSQAKSSFKDDEIKPEYRNDQQTENNIARRSMPDDSQLAARWIGKHPTAWGMGEFRRYQDGIWKPVHKDDIRKEVKGIIDSAKWEGVKSTSGLLNSVVELARIEISINPDRWDSQPDYLVCGNGLLHIPGRYLLPHAPELYMTSRLEFDYDSKADAPAFKKVLRQIPDAAEFIQEFSGYALTLDTSHEIALWLYGVPGSGKSTILTGLQAMMGTRAGILGLSDIERSRFALAQLPGKTLVISTEQPDSYISATHILNAIISGEKITVDLKFKDAITILPRAKVAWAMNDMPRINSANNGIMRRVKVVKFPELPENERDPNLKERVKLEGAGILNWALDGLDRLRARGRFAIPQCVEEATNEFKEKNDLTALFLEDIDAKIGLDLQTQSQTLYDRYSAWCERNGHRRLSSVKVADEWRRHGFEKTRINGSTYWKGVYVTGG